MADRDRAAVNVEQFVGDAQLVAAIEHLHRERLVQLPQPDIVHLEAEAFEQFGNREHRTRSEEHTSELQSLMRISYAVFCLKKNKSTKITVPHIATIPT